MALKSNVVLFSRHRTQIEPHRDTGTGTRKREHRVQLDDPQRYLGPSRFRLRAVRRPMHYTLDPLPQRCLLSSLSLLMPRFQPPQTVYRQILHPLYLILQHLFLLFRVGYWAITPPTPADWGRGGERKVYNLEGIEIRERVARVD